ncbi:MAG: glycosyl hydrolase family 8 [Verrucomicrobia bacterium]|jgi:oligosaccharide reducing-end xylanase|nr:glycosyl hydrolase family 8 [Verrucomicrobiota bacterium]
MRSSLAWLLASALPLGLAGCGSSPEAPSESGAVATGQYRNLFVEAGHSPEAVSARIEAAFQQLFHGDPDSQALYYPAGTNANGPLAYIYDVGSGDVRSEGMSYGMMIAVQLNRKAEFDALWNWSKSHMSHASPDHPAHGFFSWSMTTNGTANDEMPAPDGEQYFVTSLYFAAARWGDGPGIFQYRAEADRLLRDLRHRPLITGPTLGGVRTAGALFEPERRMIRFTPDLEHRDHTDPSYHLPAFYEVWARCGPGTEREFWREAAEASREFFQKAAHPVTGLMPDYANFDGTPWAAPWKPRSVDFQYDAWRCAMNWSVDWSWWGRDLRERELSDRLQAFFESQGMGGYGQSFTLEGRPLDGTPSSGLVAMNAVASLAATHPRSGKFVEALWATPLPTGRYRYYDGMLYLLALLHCSGEFRVWLPQ